MKVGMIGYSDQNGHPFSFSAIINGYDPQAMQAAGWSVISNYLQHQPVENFGFENIKVTHAWTQDLSITENLCRACKIDNKVSELSQLLNVVDAVVIARDDEKMHRILAEPFLKAGMPVFIDKPLALNPVDLDFFMPYVEKGQLMSTSGLRYAKELDELRDDPSQLGELKLINAIVLNNLSNYGIHLLDAIAGLNIGKPIKLIRKESPFEDYNIILDNGSIVHLSCLGAISKTFRLSFFGTLKHLHFDLHDNFTAFKRTLAQFFKMIKLRIPPVDPHQLWRHMRLIAKAEMLQYGQAFRVE